MPEWLSSREVAERWGLRISVAEHLTRDLSRRLEDRPAGRGRPLSVFALADVEAAIAEREVVLMRRAYRKATIMQRWENGAAVQEIAEALGVTGNAVRGTLKRAGYRGLARKRQVPRTSDTRPKCARCKIVLEEAEQMVPGGDDEHCAACLYRIRTGQRWTRAALREAA